MLSRTSVRFWSTAGAVSAIALSGCRDNPVSVPNVQQPDVTHVFASARDVETVISKLFQQLYNGQFGSSDDIQTQTLTMSFESSSQLGNFGMGTRGSIPRTQIDNSIGNAVATGNFRDFDFLSRNARGTANAIAALDRFIAKKNATGTPARDARARSFGYFALGYALGSLALIYDSAAIISPADSIDPATGNIALPPFSVSSAVATAALTDLDSAIAIANSANATTGSSGWPIPLDWLGQGPNQDVSRTDWIKLVRSYKARFRADVARTPTERAAVDWPAVIADATNGISADFVIQASTVTGWNADPQQQLAVSTAWSQMTPFVLGMADTTGAYDAWLQQAVTARTPFLIRTPDKRFPSGDTRALQQAVTGNSRAGTAAGSVLYFRNRPTGEDSPADPWGTSFYDNWRSWAIRASGGNGPYVLYPLAENDMLAAEGYLRTSQFAAAATLINKYRTRAGLPALTAVISLNDQVPNSSPIANDCVPRVPQPPNFTTTACGTVFEAMKWEKRLETSMVGYASWFIDSRGWGDLATGTSLEWPVPYQELFARTRASYNATAAAAKGTYGF